jgi:predicted acylesterase/phospholipase RssA
LRGRVRRASVVSLVVCVCLEVAFDADGEDGFVDGSLAADLPFERLATLFNVSNFIVSQGGHQL